MKVFWTTLAVVAALLVQSGLSQVLPPAARLFDPFLLVLVYCGLAYGETHAMMAGAAAGWVQDVHFGGPVLGLSGLTKVVLGFLVGIVPGSAHIIASFLSYAVERRVSKRPEEFGKGAVAGVAGPEAANNAASTGAFVPMLALGLPTGPVTAVLMAALLIKGIAPGPELDKHNRELRQRVVEDGRFYIVGAQLPTGYFLRSTIMNPLIEPSDFDDLLRHLRELCRK